MLAAAMPTTTRRSTPPAPHRSPRAATTSAHATRDASQEGAPVLILPDTLAFMQALWALVHALERTSKRMASSVGVTGPQRLVLRVLGLVPRLSAGELAATLHVHPSTLTGVLERLVAQGLVGRVVDQIDRRRAVLFLTPKGTRINTVRLGTVETAVTAALASVRPGDRAATLRVLQTIAAALNGAETTAPT